MSRLAHCSLPTSIPIHIYAHGFKWNAKSIYQFERESGVIKRHRNIRFSSVPIAFSFFYRNKCMMYWNSSSEQIKSTMKNNFHERLLRKKDDRIESHQSIDTGNELHLLRFCLSYFGIFPEGWIWIVKLLAEWKAKIYVSMHKQVFII